MPINHVRSAHELRFTLWGDVFVHIAVWTQTFDSFVIRKRDQEEIKAAMIYQLQHLGSGYIVSVFSTESHLTTVFHTSYTSMPDNLSEPCLVFVLGQQELDLLQNWEYWNEALAFTSRYVYQFDTSMSGHLGYSVQVTDVHNEVKISL